MSESGGNTSREGGFYESLSTSLQN